MSNNQTLEHRRMNAAYNACKDARTTDPEVVKAILRSFGPMVLRAGLLQALAFVQRDKDAIGRELSDALRTHLEAVGILGKAQTDLLEQCRTLPEDTYMLATREVLALSLWLSRST